MATKKDQAAFDYLNDMNDNSGFEGLNLDTMAVPFVRLVQDISPVMKPSKPEYNPDARPGMFVNTVNGKLYTQPLKVIIGKFEHMFLEWHATTRGKLMGVHTPEVVTGNMNLDRDDRNQLIDPASRNTFSETYTYYIVLPDYLEEGICIMSMASTSIKEAKKLNRNLMHTMLPSSNKRALPYFMVWTVDSVPMSNDKGDWLAPRFTFDSFVTQLQLEAVVEEREALPNKHVDYAMIEDTSSSDSNTSY